MNVSDVMTPEVLSVTPDASVVTTAQLMLQKRISGVPVIDDLGHLVGIVTEGDFLRRAETDTGRRRPRWIEFFMGPGRLADEYVRLSGRKVHDVMTHEVRTVPPDAPVLTKAAVPNVPPATVVRPAAVVMAAFSEEPVKVEAAAVIKVEHLVLVEDRVGIGR